MSVNVFGIMAYFQHLHMFTQIMNKVILLFFLIGLAVSPCSNPAQPEGKCTNCSPTDILIGGSCFTKIRGCLRHLPGPLCQQCQSGYVLNTGACIREAIFLNRTNLSQIPPVKIENPGVLTIAEAKNRLGEEYGEYFSQAYLYFVERYGELAGAKIANVSKMETKKGTFIVIEYSVDSNKRYEAISFVDLDQNVKEWSFSAINNKSRDPITAESGIRQALAIRLKDLITFQMKQEADFLIFDFTDGDVQVIRVILNRNDLLLANIADKLRVENLKISDLGIQQIMRLNKVGNSKPTSVQKYDNLYVVAFGPNLYCSFLFKNYRFVVNDPYLVAMDPQPPSNMSYPILGGFSVYNNLTNPNFQACLNLLVQQFPELANNQIVNVQSQVVAGTIFIIRLRKEIAGMTNQYQFKAFSPLQASPKIIQGKRNNRVIYSSNHNYNTDNIFLTNFKVIDQFAQVANPPPISTVQFKQAGNTRYYKVVYSEAQFAQFQYLGDENKTVFISYTIEGENIVQKLSEAKNDAQSRSPEILLSFVQLQEPTSAGARVISVQLAASVYALGFISKNGTFKAWVQDKGGKLILSNFTKISALSCYQMSRFEIENDNNIKIINQFLRNNYPLADYSIQLIQINMDINLTTYRLLYANNKLRQIQIWIDEVNKVGTITKAAYANFGLQLLENLESNADYLKLLQALRNSQLAGSKTPFFTQGNSTTVKSYYNDGKSTYEIFYDRVTRRATAFVLWTRPYVLVPSGFALQNQVFPSGTTAQTNATLRKIGEEAIKNYPFLIKDATLIFADKNNNSYTLMLKNSYGYQRLEASVEPDGSISIDKIIITGYKDGDFSNCLRIGINEKCQTCNPETEIQYQGACHAKMVGCLIQPGPICVRCNVDYIKVENRCVKQCTAIFR